MNYRFTLFALFTLLAFASVSVAQTMVQAPSNKITQPEKCGFDQRHQEMMQTNPAYRNRIAANEAKIQQLLGNNAFRNGSDTLTIPVVVHVIHLGEAVGTATNISDAQIQSAIDNMNDRYNGTVGTSTDTKIQFCLAQRDTNCNSITGIYRVDGTGVTDYSTKGIEGSGNDGASETSVKALSKLDPASYCNIWVVSEIDDNGAGAGTQGYAYFPGASSAVDGIVVLYNAFGYDPTTALGYELKSYTNENTTLTHEMGHYLDLYHTFEGDGGGCCCPANADCAADGDLVCDTQAHIRSGSGCPSGANGCDSGNLEDIVDNYMNYASETCTVNFTTGQKDRMRAAACGTRSGLLNGLQCVAPTETVAPEAATCTPTYTTPNGFGMGITNVTLNNLDFSSPTSQVEGGRQDRTCTSYTVLETNTMYTVSVDLGVSNNQDVTVWIDYNNDGDFLDAGEEIFSDVNGLSLSGMFTTPASPVLDTLLRMRVIGDWFNNTISGPCYTPQYGEVEEYSILFESSNPAPVAEFSADATSQCISNTVTYTDASTNSTGWSWDFGAGATPATAATQGPHVVTYSSTGQKTVTLDVTGPGGSDNEDKTNYVTINADVDASNTGSTDDSCGNCDGTATVTASGGNGSYTYSWSSGNMTGTITGLCAGTYTVTVSDGAGCTDSGTEVVAASCSVPNTQLQAAYNGTTVGSFSQYFYCDAVASVERYQWRFVNVGASIDQEILSLSSNPTSNIMAMTLVPNLQYGLTYDVTVRAKVGGQWGTYSTVSTLSAPASIPTTQLSAGDCGTLLGAINDYFFYDFVQGAERYQLDITDNATFNQTPSSPFNYPTAQFFSLAFLDGVDYNTTYDVQVRAKVGGVWGNYGAICTVTTPAVTPTTALIGSDCGSTLGSVNDYFYITGLPGAQRYGYEITDGGSYNEEIFTPSYAPSATWMTLGFAPNIQLNTTYNIRVRAKVNGVWGAYGSVCTVTTPAAKSNQPFVGLADEQDARLLAWPNPSSGAINIGVAGLEAGEKDIYIQVFDIVGKQVYNSRLLSTEGVVLQQINTANEFLKGVYMLRVTVDGQTMVKKIVVE